jgi:hypothetical protein
VKFLIFINNQMYANNFIAKYSLWFYRLKDCKLAFKKLRKMVVLVNILKQKTSRNAFIIENLVVNKCCLSMTNIIASLTWAGTICLWAFASFKIYNLARSRSEGEDLNTTYFIFESQEMQSIYMVSKRYKQSLLSILIPRATVSYWHACLFALALTLDSYGTYWIDLCWVCTNYTWCIKKR